MATNPKAATKRFYIPQHVREVVNSVAAACDLTPGEVVEGAVGHMMREHARTGQPPGRVLRAMIDRGRDSR